MTHWYRNRVARALLLATALLAVGAAAPAYAGGSRISKLDRALQDGLASGTASMRVIVRTTPGSRGRVVERLRRQGHRIHADHPTIDGFTAEVRAEDLETFAGDPAVIGISIDAEIRPSSLTDAEIAAIVSLQRDTLGIASNMPTGAGVRVAVIDSGIQEAVGLGGRTVAFYDFTAGGVATTATDGHGHGTHIATLIGGDGLISGLPYKGIAPGATLVGLKVLDEYGRGYTSHVISAIEFAIANRAALGIDIINLSLGHPIYEPAATDPLVQAVERATRAGIVVVVAAGNVGSNPTTGEAGYAGILSPGNAPSAITVGATTTEGTSFRSDDRIARYSSRGPTWYDGFAKPDIVAPGHGILAFAAVHSWLYDAYPELLAAKKVGQLSGTSMATAVATGVVALVLEASRTANPGTLDGCVTIPAPRLSPNAVKAILQHTALPLRDEAGALYDALSQGAGGINAGGAIALAKAINTAAPVGSPWLTTGVTAFSTIGGETLAWFSNIIWGDNIVWADATYANQTAWAHNIVWGENIVWADNIIWGESIVWGQDDNIVWTNNIVWGDGRIGMSDGLNTVWGQDDNIVWGLLTDDNIVWANLTDDNIVWGLFEDNIVWGLLNVDEGVR
jgi:serine protease AprX